MASGTARFTTELGGVTVDMNVEETKALLEYLMWGGGTFFRLDHPELYDILKAVSSAEDQIEERLGVSPFCED